MSETIFNEKGKVAVQCLFGVMVETKSLSVSQNPYKADVTDLIDVHCLDNGKEVWTDHATGRLVQVGDTFSNIPLTERSYCREQRLKASELRERAVRLIERMRPDFKEKRPTLHPLEDNRQCKCWYFRWDDFSTPVSESEMPPFIQVALWADGTLASFTDTMSR